MHLERDAPAAARPLIAAAAWRRVVAIFLAERERWALWLPVALGLGVVVYFALRFEPSLWLGPTWVALAIAIGFALRARTGGMLLALVLAVSGLGFAAAQVRTAMVAAPVVPREIGPVAVTGRVVLVEQRPDDRRLTLADVVISGLEQDATPARIRVTVRARGAAIAPSQRVSLRAVLLPPSPPARSTSRAKPGSSASARSAMQSPPRPCSSRPTLAGATRSRRYATVCPNAFMPFSTDKLVR